MKTQNLSNIALSVVVICLLVWNGIGSHPTAAASVSPEATVTGSISVSGSSAIRVQPNRVDFCQDAQQCPVPERAPESSRGERHSSPRHRRALHRHRQL
jgi:hypothetical protein